MLTNTCQANRYTQASERSRAKDSKYESGSERPWPCQRWRERLQELWSSLARETCATVHLPPPLSIRTALRESFEQCLASRWLSNLGSFQSTAQSECYVRARKSSLPDATVEPQLVSRFYHRSPLESRQFRHHLAVFLSRLDQCWQTTVLPFSFACVARWRIELQDQIRAGIGCRWVLPAQNSCLHEKNVYDWYIILWEYPSHHTNMQAQFSRNHFSFSTFVQFCSIQ